MPRVDIRRPALLRARPALVCAVAVAVFATACGGSTPTAPDSSASVLTPVSSSEEWPASTPAAEGLNPAVLGDLVRRIRDGEHGSIDSLLVIRRGVLVVEEYFAGMSASSVHTMQSVSKSVTSLITGIAIGDGRLGLDTRAAGLFDDYAPFANPGADKSAITVRDLLTMRGGWDWSESTYAGSPLDRMNQCRCDWLRYMLDWPLREPPGSRWEYVSGGVILLGGAVGRAAGSRIDLVGDERLFEPLGVAGAYWIAGLPDLVHTGGGLFMRPRDLAKIGQLVLDGGRWRGRQIVSDAWIRESTAPFTPSVAAFEGRTADYGYLWWRLRDRDVITAAGARGQWLFVVPSMSLVVVSTAQNSPPLDRRPVRFLYSHVLASIGGG